LNNPILILLLFLSSLATSQEKKEQQLSLKKVGILFSSAKQNNILFFDKDYDYKTMCINFNCFIPYEQELIGI
jgi:hypothetical protein